MADISIANITKTTILYAFTFTTALIWKDVIIEFIHLVVPASEQLEYKFLAALVATGIIIAAAYVILQTEHEAEVVIERLKAKNRKLEAEVKPKKRRKR